MGLTSLMPSRKPQVLVPELRYPCHRYRPCCYRHPCHYPPPPHRRHHHETDALDILDIHAKTPGLYLVPELRYSCHCCRPCRCPPSRCRLPHHRHHHLGSWKNTRGKSSRKP